MKVFWILILFFLSAAQTNANSKLVVCKPILSQFKIDLFTYSQSLRREILFHGRNEIQIQTTDIYVSEFRLGDLSRNYGQMMSLTLNKAKMTLSSSSSSKSNSEDSIEFLTSSLPLLQFNKSLSGVVENGFKKQDFYFGKLKSMDMNSNYEVHVVTTSQRESLSDLNWTPLSSVISIYKLLEKGRSRGIGSNNELRRELVYRIDGPGALLSLKYLTSLQ